MAPAHKLQLHIIIDWCLSAANALSRPHILASRTDSAHHLPMLPSEPLLFIFLFIGVVKTCGLMAHVRILKKLFDILFQTKDAVNV